MSHPETATDPRRRAGSSPSNQAQPVTPLMAAKTPVQPGTITAVGLVLAVLVVVVGIIGVHDALVAAGFVYSQSWLAAAISGANGTTPAVWCVPVGIVLVLAGLWLLIIALRPRPRTVIPLDARTGVYLRPRDVSKLARNAAETVDGVASATVEASRRKVVVSVRATSPDGLAQRVEDAVTDRLQALAPLPRVRVDVTTQGA